MIRRSIKKFILCVFVATVVCSCAAIQALALNIDSTDKYAWGENIGWINFGTTQGDVDVMLTSMDGYAWGENVGWISLNCSNTASCSTVNYGAALSGTTVSGYIWGENVGWISLNCSNTASCSTVNYGVSVDTSTGIFSGYAWGENVGWISFNCSNDATCTTVNYKVKTSASLSGGRIAHPPGGGSPTPTLTPTTTSSPTPSASATPSVTPTETPTPSLSVTPTPTLSGSPLPSFTPLPSGSVLPTPPVFPTPTASPPIVAPTQPPPEPFIPPVVELIDAITTAVEDTAQLLLGPVAQLITENCVGPLGTAACGATSVSTAAVGLAVAAAVAQNEVAATSFSMLQIVGLRKRAKVWGVVYDSASKRPIPLAKIELLDASGRVLETRFADRDGRYGFLTSPASLHQQELRVIVRVEKPGYRFPSTFSLTGTTDYVVYDNIYRGGEIVLQGDSLVRFNIPMDPTSKTRASWSGFGLGLIGTFGDRVLSLGFYIGIVVVPLNWWFAPTVKNIVIGAIFIVMNGIRMFALYRPYGATLDATTGKRLPFALVTLHDLQGTRLGFSVSDEHGRFILSGEQGKDYELIAYTPANVSPQRSIRLRVRGFRCWSTRAWVTADLRI